MKRAAVACALAVVSFLLLTAADAPEPPIPPLGIEVIVQPSSMDAYQLLARQTPATYTCSALIMQAGEKRAFALPRLIAKPGKREVTTTKTPLFDVSFAVLVNEKRTRASTEVIVTRDGRILHRQTSNILLAPEPPRPLLR